MIKYFIVSLLVGYILRKFIFFPINQPRSTNYDHPQNHRQQQQSPPSSKPPKEIREEDYTDYEEVK